MTVYVSDRRSFTPNVRLLFKRAADESRVRVVRALDLFFDVSGIDESDRAVDIDYGLNRARDAQVVTGAFEVCHAVRRSEQRNEMSTCGRAHRGDAIRIGVEACSVGAQPANRSFQIVNRRRILRLIRKPILDRRRDVSAPGEFHRERIFHRVIAGNPCAPMDQDDCRKRTAAFGLKEIEMHFARTVTLINDSRFRCNTGRQFI